MPLLHDAKQFFRRRLRAIRRAGHFPLLLPHHELDSAGVRTLGRAVQVLPQPIIAALRLCDGTKSVSQVARVSGVSRLDLLQLHEREMLILWRGPVPAEPPAAGNIRTIILSPHLDDAPLSLGGMLLRGEPGTTLVIDVFTRAAWSRFPVELDSPAQVQQVRWSEEQVMARLAGVALVNVGLPEALLRGRRFEEVYTAAADDRDEEARPVLEGIIDRHRRQHPAARWFLPLAVGNHLDHRVVRDVSLACLRESGVPLSQVRFYEDLPHAAEKGNSQSDFARMVPNLMLEPEPLDIGAVCAWKIEMNRVYWSQLLGSQVERLRDYAMSIGQGRAVERYWRTPRA